MHLQQLTSHSRTDAWKKELSGGHSYFAITSDRYRRKCKLKSRLLTVQYDSLIQSPLTGNASFAFDVQRLQGQRNPSRSSTVKG